MSCTALITGITGQDGAYLARFLLDKGYHVHGMQMYETAPGKTSLSPLMAEYPGHFHLHYGDMTDAGCLYRLLTSIQPDEIYNLAALSHVQVSFDLPEAAAHINALGTLRLLEAIRHLKLLTRYYQASSSEMYGNAPAPQNEETPFQPCSPYAASKLYAYWLVRTYRQSYGLHASNGILFNHESPLRGEEFVTRKITRAIAGIMAGNKDVLTLGNLEARRDWGHARDYVEGMWQMLQKDKPDDYVLATGEPHSVREFVETAFACMGLSIAWSGEGLAEKGLCRQTGKVLIEIDPTLFRPAEINYLCGDARKAQRELGWVPKTGFAALVQEMVTADMDDICANDKSGDSIVYAAG